LFLPGVIPERALITADTSVLGVPGGSEEDISDSLRYQGISWKGDRGGCRKNQGRPKHITLNPIVWYIILYVYFDSMIRIEVQDPLVTVGLFRLCLPLGRSWRDGGTTTVVDHHTGKRPKD
jgi:hypothetical protein